jgi:hypothetical protein
VTLNEEIRCKINTDPDYIAIKRFDYSLDKVIEKYPDGAPTKVICTALLMEEEEVMEMYEKIVLKIRGMLDIRD